MFSPCSTRCGQVPPRLVIGRPGAATKPAPSGHVPTPSLWAGGMPVPVCRSATRDLHQREGFSSHANCLACAADCSARPCGLYRRARAPGAAGNRGHAGRAAAHSGGSSWVNSNCGDPLARQPHASTHSGDRRGRPGDAGRLPACLLRGLAWADIRMVLRFAMMFSAVSLSGWRRHALPCRCAAWSGETTRVMGAHGRRDARSNEAASPRHASLAVLAMTWVGCPAC
jgi:hypothetical protein